MTARDTASAGGGPLSDAPPPGATIVESRAMPAHALVTSRTPGTRNGNRRRAAIVAAALLGAALGGAYIGALEHHLIWALMSVAFLLASTSPAG